MWRSALPPCEWRRQSDVGPTPLSARPCADAVGRAGVEHVGTPVEAKVVDRKRCIPLTKWQLRNAPAHEVLLVRDEGSLHLCSLGVLRTAVLAALQQQRRRRQRMKTAKVTVSADGNVHVPHGIWRPVVSEGDSWDFATAWDKGGEAAAREVAAEAAERAVLDALAVASGQCTVPAMFQSRMRSLSPSGQPMHAAEGRVLQLLAGSDFSERCTCSEAEDLGGRALRGSRALPGWE